MRRPLVAGALALLAAACLFILVGGVVAGGCVESRVESRLAAALDAKVDIGDTSVSFASGVVELEDVAIERDGVSIEIKRIKAQLPSLGRMVFSRRPTRVEVDGARFEMSARGAVAMARRQRQPLHIETLVVTDTVIAVAPSALLPTLGRVELKIDLAESRDVNLASALTWVTKLDALVANAALPAGAGAGVTYRDETLELTGQFFGADALRVPFKIPDIGPELLEREQLIVIAKALAKAVGKHVAKDKLIDAARDFLDL